MRREGSAPGTPGLRRRARRLAVVGILAGVLAGCGQPAQDLSDDAASQLQTDVLAVTQASGAGDVAAARAALAVLTDHVAASRAQGDLSGERRDLIEAAVVLVSADLATLEQEAADAQAADDAATAKAATDAAAAAKAAEKAKEVTPDKEGGPGKSRDKDKDN